MQTDASIVIPTFNRKDLLKTCLECLSAQEHPKERFEVIVVDDGSTDGTGEMIESQQFDCQLNYISYENNKGLSTAKNIGIDNAKGEIVIFLDSDAFAPPWYVSEHVKSHQKGDKLIVDGPAINITREEDAKRLAFNSFSNKMLAFLDFAGGTFINVNTSVRREHLVELGGFDETFLGFEDLELLERLRTLNLTRLKNTRAYVLHYKVENSTLDQIARRKRVHGERAANYYNHYPTEKNGKVVRLRYLKYDRIYSRLGLDKYLDLEYLTTPKARRSPLFSTLKRLFIMRSYTEGLRSSLNNSHKDLEQT